MALERDFKRWCRNILGRWNCAIEPALGADLGVPDLMVLRGGLLLPIELKVGEIVDGRLFPRKVRPDQIQFMEGLMRAGGECCFVVGVYDGEWKGFGTRNCRARNLSTWKKGFDIDAYTVLSSTSDFDRFFGV